MGGGALFRRLPGGPAWRASSTDEEARAFFQYRLAAYSGVLFASLVAFLGFFALLYRAFPSIVPALTPQIFMGAALGLVVLAILWRGVLVRHALSLSLLELVDLFYAVAAGSMLACSGYFAPERRAASYSAMIEAIFVVFMRALVVPSTGRRTALLASLTFVPVIAAGIGLAITTTQDIPGPAFVMAGIVLATVAVLLAMFGSRLIYGLRRQVREAMQLGQYTLDCKIGEGGIGTVYRAHHVLLRRPTAIKLLRPDRVGAETLDRFEREVQHTSQLSHPNTVAVFDYGRSPDGFFYYAMEYLEGIDLEQLVRRYGPLPPGRAIEIMIQICGALQEAHDRGIVHRDIKPANIILCEHAGTADVAKIVDFGLVKEITHDAIATHENILGTPAYVAPETITNPACVSAAADLYALGAVGYFLVSGRRVFTGHNVVDVCIQHVTATPPPLSQLAIGVPPALEAVIMTCLHKRPEDRYASAATLADALRGIPHDWTEAAAMTWWTQHPKAGAPVSASSPTKTITIDMAARA